MESCLFGSVYDENEDLIINEDGNELKFKFSKFKVKARKTDKIGRGTVYELHDDPINEPDVMVNTKLTNWKNYMYY